jgi:hypothetical protein
MTQPIMVENNRARALAGIKERSSWVILKDRLEYNYHVAQRAFLEKGSKLSEFFLR